MKCLVEKLHVSRHRRPRLPGKDRQAACPDRGRHARVRTPRRSESPPRGRGGLDELLAYREGRRWREINAADINGYIKSASGDDFSAKDFRTWHATVLAEIGVAVGTRHAQSN
jgi:hypothetical protein